jgi:hypothetical protein
VFALVAAGTAFASPGNPDVSINPPAGQAGTTITLTGDNFPPGDLIQVGFEQGNCDAAQTIISGASATADAHGDVSITFPWQTSNPGTFAICATDTSTHKLIQSTNTFKAFQAPTLKVTSSVYSGQQFTVTGQGFIPTSDQFGGTVDILYGTASNPCANVAGTATVGTDKSFTVQITAPHADTDTPITIIAVEPQHTCGQTNPSPTVQAQTPATVSPAPAITISPQQAQSGGYITVSGQHFLPAGNSVGISYGLGANADGCATTSGMATAGTDGSFSYRFKAPNVAKDTPITVVAVEPAGSCASPQLRAAVTGTVKPVPATPNYLAYCIIGLLILLLLLLLLFLLFRRRKQDEPVTIEERDRVFVPAANAGGSGATGGTALIDRQIVARDKRGREVVIAEEVTTVEEEEE